MNKTIVCSGCNKPIARNENGKSITLVRWKFVGKRRMCENCLKDDNTDQDVSAKRIPSRFRNSHRARRQPAPRRR